MTAVPKSALPALGAAPMTDGSTAGKVEPLIVVYGRRPSSRQVQGMHAVTANLHDLSLEKLGG